MVIQRICFMLTWMTLLVAGGSWGICGGMFITEHFFRNPITGRAELSLVVFLWSLGSLIGAAAALFGAILPLYFKFPNARRKFSWESTDPPMVFRFYQWYGEQLAAYGAARERGEH